MSQNNANYGFQTTAQGITYLYVSRSVHSLAKRRKLLPGAGEVQKFHVHDTNTYSQQKQAPAGGYWHSLPSDSCSEPDGKQPFQFCSKPHPNTSITADSQAGISTKRANGQRSQIPPCCRCHPSRKGVRHIWCGRERSRELQAFRCCTCKALMTFILYTGNVWVQC